MSRTTPKPDRTQFARPMDLEIVAIANIAVSQTMKKLHERNPAGWHLRNPMGRYQGRWYGNECPFDSSCPFTSDTPE